MATRMTRAEIRGLCDSVFAAYNAHDVDGVLATVSDDVLWKSPDVTCNGKDEVAADLQELFAAFPDAAWPLDQMAVLPSEDNATIAVTWRWQGTHTGTYSGLPATGRKVDVEGVSVVKVRDGLISENTFYFDSYAYLEQLGVVPSLEGLGFKVLATAEITLNRAKRALRR